MALTDEAIDKIKDMIISGRVRPGEAAREADLAAELGPVAELAAGSGKGAEPDQRARRAAG